MGYEAVWTIDKMITHGLKMDHYIGSNESKMHGLFWFDAQIMALKILMHDVESPSS